MAGPIAFYTPDPIQSTQLIPGGNTPAAGAQLFVYQVGTTTKQNSYTDASASTARTNPIVLDSGGNIPGNGEVWIVSSAKFVLAPSNDTDPPASPYWTRDNVPGINNVAALIAASATGEWVQGSTATFVGATQFSVVGDQTALYTLGRRVKATVTGGDRFGIVTSAVLAANTTAIGVTLDSGTLNGGLSSVSYGILGTPNGSVPWEIQTTSGTGREGRIDFYNVAYNAALSVVSAAAAPDIWSVGNTVSYFGTTAASSFANAPQPGAIRTLICQTSAVFTSSATLLLQVLGGARQVSSYTASPNDKLEIVATSTNAFTAFIAPVTSTNVIAGSLVFLASTLANNTSAIVFGSSVISNIYDEYEFHLLEMIGTSTLSHACCRLSTSNGGSWLSTNQYLWTVQGGNTAGGSFTQGPTTATSEIMISNTSGVSNSQDLGGVNGVFKLFSPAKTSSVWKRTLFNGYGADQSATGYVIHGAATVSTVASTSMNAIQFFYRSGNISSGTFYAYGIGR